MGLNNPDECYLSYGVEGSGICADLLTENVRGKNGLFRLTLALLFFSLPKVFIPSSLKLWFLTYVCVPVCYLWGKGPLSIVAVQSIFWSISSVSSPPLLFPASCQPSIHPPLCISLCLYSYRVNQRWLIFRGFFKLSAKLKVELTIQTYYVPSKKKVYILFNCFVSRISSFFFPPPCLGAIHDQLLTSYSQCVYFIIFLKVILVHVCPVRRSVSWFIDRI